MLASVVVFNDVHAACQLAAQGEGRVTHIIDARTFRLDDGREVRLTNIESGPTRDAAKTLLASLIDGRDIILQGADDRPDRYGRQHAVVFVAGSDKSIQTELLSRGIAVMWPIAADSGCMSEWNAAEASARTAKLGVWGGDLVTKNAERSGDILATIGQMTVVEGTILSARQAGGTFYINFGRRWTQDFAVTISRRMMTTVEQAGFSLKSLDGKKVRVRGWVEKRGGPSGGPRIDISQAGQIELIGGNADATRAIALDDKSK